MNHGVSFASDRDDRAIQTRATPVRGLNGDLLEWLGPAPCVDDLDQLREHQDLLLGELRHRVCNILSVVRSIARRTAETSLSVADHAAHLDGRLGALARTQALLTQTPGLGAPLLDLIADEIQQQTADTAQVSMEGPEVLLVPATAELLALAIHELATNAIKYGALSTAQGRLKVSWTIDDAARTMNLLWVESGVRIVSRAPRRRGFGSELIERSIPYELDGSSRIDFRPGGVQCSISIPMVEGRKFREFSASADPNTPAASAPRLVMGAQA